jgi:hypothetical protein
MDTMIQTREVLAAIRRKEIDKPELISTKDYLPFPGEYVPIVTENGEVMRGHLMLGGNDKIYWIGTVMSYGSGEVQLSLDQVLYWLG